MDHKEKLTKMTKNEIKQIELPKDLLKTKAWKINSLPFKILDAPNLQDDYYLNLVDWSQSDNLAVGMKDIVYVWNFQNGNINKLL